MSESEQVVNQFGEAPAGPTLSYVPEADIPREDGFLEQGQPAIRGGGPSNQLAPDADLPTNTRDPNADIPTKKTYKQIISDHYASMQAQRDALIKGSTEDLMLTEMGYKEGAATVKDELIDVLTSRYSEEFVNQGALNNLEDKSPEEQVRLLTAEFMRSASDQEQARNLLALNMLRQGLGDKPVEALNDVWMSLTPSQTQALYQQWGRVQKQEVQGILDSMAAQEGVGFTADVALGEMVYQDLVPFVGAISRVMVTNKFLPEDVEINPLRQLLPGEVRQEIREWWTQASHEERVMWLTDLQKEWDRIRKGENSKWYTRYVTIENMMGIFTEDLLNNQDPTDTLDRVLGNLDTALGGIIAVGTISKKGLGVFDLFKSNKTNLSRNLASAGGSRQAQEALDKVIQETAAKYGLSAEDASVPNLTKPEKMAEDVGLEVETDSVKHLTSPTEARRARVLDTVDEADSTLLTLEDKQNAIEQIYKLLDDNDTIHMMHKMSTVKGLDNGTGVQFKVMYGSRTGEGWIDILDLVDDMVEVNPYETFKIYRRNADGVLEEIPVTMREIADLKASGRIPDSLKAYIEPRTPEAEEFGRLFGGRPINRVSMDELKAALDNEWIPLDSPMHDWVREEIRLRNAKGVDDLGPDPLLALDGDEFFVQIEKTHYFNWQDMTDLDVFRYFENASKTDYWQLGNIASRLFPPNTKFDRLYEAAKKNYNMEEAALSDLQDIVAPFSNLSAKRKQKVGEILEYIEQHAKDMHHIEGVARTPDVSDLRVTFPDVDQKTWEGYIALRDTMDTMYDLFNRRLYRDFNNRGFKTIRSLADGDAPNYHGVPLDKAEVTPGKYFDPSTGKLIELDAEEIADILDNGGGAVKLDFALTSEAGEHYDLVLARPGEYEIGRLSDRVLNYYEGYHFRFYEDPFYIVKRTYDPEINGRKATAADEGVMRDKDGRLYTEEAIRTAESHESAVQFLNRGKKRYRDTGRGTYARIDGKGPVFTIKPAREISNHENTLYQKQALQREGRMFWDERNRRRLPDTTGNRARVADPSFAMEKGLAMAMRQVTQEGLFESMIKGFKAEFGDLPEFTKNKHKLTSDSLHQLEKDLVDGRRSATGETRKRYAKALEIIRYMRTQLGTDSFAVPILREMTYNLAVALERMLGRPSKALGRMQAWGMSLDPFAAARKVAYGAFMVLRPARQAILQSAQVSMLFGLAPGYIGTGKIFLDALALRRGLTRYRWAGFDDGWSDASVAKVLGMSKKEYKRLVEEFHRSGLLGSVNTHSFNASGRGLQSRLDPNAGAMGRAGYKVKAGGRAVYNAAAKYGFEFGEKNNLTFSYLVALRRMKKKFGDDITKWNRSQWDEVALEADALGLAMSRPNKMTYQTGYMGMLLQFMSFQHKALVTMLGMNPRLTRADTTKLVVGMYALWGFNIADMETEVREVMAASKIGHLYTKPVFGNVTWGDLLTGGLVEASVNGLASAMDSEWKDLNLGILAPGAAVVRIYKEMIELATEAPAESYALMGPFSNQYIGMSKGLQFAIGEFFHNESRSPTEKFLRSGKYLLQNVLPQFNDANRAWLSYQMNDWVDKDGDKMGIQPVMNTLVARGLMGIRSEEEMSRYRMRTLHWEEQKNIDNWVEAWQPVIKEMLFAWGENKWSDEAAYEIAGVIHSLTESAPEGVRREIYRRLLTDPFDDGKSVAELIAEISKSGTADLKSFIPHVYEQTDWTAEEKQTMVDFINQITDGYKSLDNQHREIIEHDLKNKGNE